MNRKLDMKFGLLCNLTGEKADFVNECKSFKLDEALIEKIDNTEAIEHHVVIRKLSVRNITKFRLEQDYTKALITGIFVGIIGTILWGVITISTRFQIGYMAIAIGAAVGFSLRIVGKGIDQIFWNHRRNNCNLKLFNG